MQSPSTKEIIDKLTEDGGMGAPLLMNELQEAMWEFMKGQLARRLEVSVDRDYGALGYSKGVKVTLKLDGEVISSDRVGLG